VTDIVIQHVGLEVPPVLMDDCVAFWQLLGFDEVHPAGTLPAEGYRWLQKHAAQIHLMPAPGGATVPEHAHVAIIDPDLPETISRLKAAGHAVTEGRQHWGTRRITTRCPAGHRVELMLATPDVHPGPRRGHYKRRG
jgi:hypothetical protein